MVPISLPYIFNLASQIRNLEQLPHEGPAAFSNMFGIIYLSKEALESLLINSVFSKYLRSSSQLGYELLGLLQGQMQTQGPMDRSVDTFALFQIRSKYSEYATALVAELGVLPSFFVTQKGGFDTASLLSSPEQLFPEELKNKVPEAMFDVAEAAKALAYEMPTACGFHVFRATETVLRRYYSATSNSTPHPKVRNISVYIQALKQFSDPVS